MTNIPALYDKKLACPICDNTFTSKKLRSRAIRVKKIENDFYTVYKDPQNNPILYEVFVCVTCGFAFTDQFKLPIKDATKEHFKKAISSNWQSQSFDEERTYDQAIATYKLALLSGKETKQPPIVVGGICLRLSWLYRYLEKEVEEKKFIKHAFEQYETSYLEGDFKETNMSEIRLLFILGELSRKLDMKEKSIKYFSHVIQHKDKHLEPTIVEKAREQWYETRERK